jgi:hypothetical protein
MSGPEAGPGGSSVRFLAKVVWGAWGALVGAAAAAFAYGGATDYGRRHPTLMGAAVTVLLMGTAGAALARAIHSYWEEVRRLNSELAQFNAQRLWEAIILSQTGIGLGDLGVHVFQRVRRAWPLWRFKYERVARMAVTSREPAHQHRVWKEHWRSGVAGGLVGLAAQQDGSDVLDVDLCDEDHRQATPELWNEWYASRDKRALGVKYEGARSAMTWFSTVWARAIRTRDGRLVGVLTMNVEREVADGHSCLKAAGAPQALGRAAQDIAASAHL